MDGIYKTKKVWECILDNLKKNQKINGFEDAYFSTIYTIKLAETIDISIKKKITGRYNCGSSDSCSKYEFAVKIAECFGLDKSLITPISIDDFNFKAKRGKNLILNVSKLKSALSHNPPTISESIAAFYRDFNKGLYKNIRKEAIPNPT
ncbi:sugar nucleotide-binding protein [Thermodesulfobacteriota bacterium]